MKLKSPSNFEYNLEKTHPSPAHNEFIFTSVEGLSVEEKWVKIVCHSSGILQIICFVSEKLKTSLFCQSEPNRTGGSDNHKLDDGSA